MPNLKISKYISQKVNKEKCRYASELKPNETTRVGTNKYSDSSLYKRINISITLLADIRTDENAYYYVLDTMEDANPLLASF